MDRYARFNSEVPTNTYLLSQKRRGSAVPVLCCQAFDLRRIWLQSAVDSLLLYVYRTGIFSPEQY